MSRKKQHASLSKALPSGGDRYHDLFDDSPVTLWEEDFSQVKKHIDDLRDSGISDFEAYFQDHPKAVRRCADLVKVIDVNRAALELFQAHNRKILLEGLSALFIEESYEAFQEELIAISEGRTICETETIAQTVAGERRNLLVRWSVAPGHEDTFARVIVSMIDITERKQAEASLRESEASKEALLEAIPDMIFLLGKDGTYLDYRPGKEIRPHIPASEFLGKKISEVLPPEVAQAIMDRAQRALETGRIQIIEYELSEEDGQHVYEGRLSASGKEKVLGVVHDITERKRIEERLRDTKESLQTLVHTAPAAIISVDNQVNVLSWNAAAEEMFGWSSQEIIGRPLPILPPDKRGEYGVLRDQYLSGEVIRNLETRRRRKDGTLLDVSLSLAPLRDASGSIYGSMGIVSDITERKRAEKALSRLSGQLLSLQDEERRRIAQGLHDGTAQKLAALGMNLSLVNEATAGLNTKVRKYLSESLTLVKQCLGEIRTLSYLLHPPLLDEVGLALALRWYADGFAERSRIRVDLDLPADLGRLPQEVETTLFRIAQECLTNIHLHSGSPTAKIEIVRDPSVVTLIVADQGGGMTSAEMKRASGTDIRMGVGLAGMRERARQFGGRLEIQSGDPGTTVKVILPLPRADS